MSDKCPKCGNAGGLRPCQSGDAYRCYCCDATMSGAEVVQANAKAWLEAAQQLNDEPTKPPMEPLTEAADDGTAARTYVCKAGLQPVPLRWAFNVVLNSSTYPGVFTLISAAEGV